MAVIDEDMVLGGHQRIEYRAACGDGRARECGGSACPSAECAGAFASRLAPTEASDVGKLRFETACQPTHTH